MASDPGVSRAAPTPCRARAAMRTPASGATAQTSEARANQCHPDDEDAAAAVAVAEGPAHQEQAGQRQEIGRSPPTGARRRRGRSPCPMAGRAMPTTVESMAATARAETVAASTQRPAGCPGGARGTSAASPGRRPVESGHPARRARTSAAEIWRSRAEGADASSTARAGHAGGRPSPGAGAPRPTASAAARPRQEVAQLGGRREVLVLVGDVRPPRPRGAAPGGPGPRRPARREPRRRP